MRTICWILAAVLCLTGWGCRRNTGPRHAVVRRICVQYPEGACVYTSQEKMSEILNGLRQLGQKTLAFSEGETGMIYEIILERTDGASTVYCLEGERFIRKNREPWQQTPPNGVSDLLRLLQSLPPDEISL